MSLDKAIEHGKEHRKQWKYKKNYCKSVDERCRNHGGARHKRQCDYCLGNRTYKYRKKLINKEVENE